MKQPVTILFIAAELACSLNIFEKKKGKKVNLVVEKIILKK